MYTYHDYDGFTYTIKHNTNKNVYEVWVHMGEELGEADVECYSLEEARLEAENIIDDLNTLIVVVEAEYNYS